MAKSNILFVDNDPNFLAGRKDFLEQEGYNVIPVETPKKAWEILTRRKVDLAILDVRLTNDGDERDESGLQLAKEMAAKHVPLVILTAFQVPKHIAEIFNIVRDISPLKLDIVGKEEGNEAMSLAVARTLAILRLEQAQRKRDRRSGRREVFLVYGHDKQAKQELISFLAQIGIRAIDISKKATQGRNIFEQFKYYSKVSFAVVLLTPDDPCFSNIHEGIRRPRQNVIFELGFLMGVLGEDRVCTLRKGNTEILSDYHGILYKPMKSDGAWKAKLAQELKAAGFSVDLDKVIEA